MQLGKKMVQSGKNETCDSRPGAPEGPGMKKRCSPRLDAPGEPWRSMHGPRPGAHGVQGRKRCTALDSVLLGDQGGECTALGPVLYGDRGGEPGAPDGPGRKMMCNPRLAHPGPHWRSSRG